jgi:general secretion pathway protein I
MTRGQGSGGREKSKGFTLLEVMLAVAILSLVIVSLMGLQSRSSQDIMLAEHMTSATLLAKRVMTETLLIKSQLPLEKEGDFEDEEFGDYTWKIIVVPSPIPQIMEVRVAVLWTEGEREEKVELVSYEAGAL